MSQPHHYHFMKEIVLRGVNCPIVSIKPEDSDFQDVYFVGKAAVY